MGTRIKFESQGSTRGKAPVKKLESQDFEPEIKHEKRPIVKADTAVDNSDRSCIFRDSPIYRSVFVYPSPGEKERQGDILTSHGKARTKMYPWQEIDNRTKALGEFHYRIRDARANQYTTELLVREIFTNPNSCLRTHNPEQATLFYVPYMPSI